MKRVGISFLAVLFLYACAYQSELTKVNDIYKTTSRTFDSTEPEVYKPRCEQMSIVPIKTRLLYQDYYGTMITTDSSSLRASRGSFRWGITNPSPSSMAYFSAYVKPAVKYHYFRTYVYIDPGIKDTMVFLFRNNDREGEVLKRLSIEPGQIKVVDIDIEGVKKIFIGSELRINHGTGTKLIFGEPEFYNCR